MKILEYPEKESALYSLMRPRKESTDKLHAVIAEIVSDVKNNGDDALYRLTKKYDGVTLQTLSIEKEARQKASQELSSQVREALQAAEKNISLFHKAQERLPLRVETTPGIVCERRAAPIERVGLYIPGGTAPLVSTLLMLAIPAKLAGCKEIVIVTPPPVHPVILAVSERFGVSEVYQVGGAQAIAALALGTKTIRPVAKIFGPGNRYVTAAKQLVSAQGDIAIDLPAGPSELLVIADRKANPEWIAADLLSQAEHGSDSQVVFITDDKPLLYDVQIAIAKQIENLPRKSIVEAALRESVSLLVSNIDEAMSLSNAYAPEHLIIATSDAEERKQFVTNAGSVFLGYNTPESLGDYASGTNHTLPTGGAAAAYSGVSLESFQKQITFQCASPDGLARISDTVVCLASLEGLDAHSRAVTIREVA